MAFVYQTSRKLSKEIQKQDIGPATYNIGQQIEPIQQSNTKEKNNSKKNNQVAPFNSTEVKLKQKINNNPGVGDYQVNNIVQNLKAKTYKCKNDLIIQINRQQASGFRSTSPRFIEQFSNDNPGVGDYNVQGDIKLKTFQHDKFKMRSLSPDINHRNFHEGSQSYKKIQVYLKSQRKFAQSIPSKVKTLQDTNISIDQQMQSTVKDITMKSNISPGQYKLKDTFELNKNKGSLWSKNKGKRFDQYVEKDVQIGPGKYQYTEMNAKDTDKPYSNYISTTTRSFWDKIYYNTNKDGVAQELNKDFQQNIQNSTGPAPNSYLQEQVVKSINIKNVREDFQFFGTSQERFKDYNKANNNPNISPTIYNIKSENFENKQARSYSPPFNSTCERVDIHVKKIFNLNPGPGEYDESYHTLKNKINIKKEKGYNGKFGNTDQRFKVKNKDIIYQAGPGRYSVKNQWISEENPIENSGFKSKSNRKLFKDPDLEVPCSYAYNVNNYEINTKLKKQKEYVNKLQKINVHRPPFDSQSIRFQHYSPQSTKQNKNKKIQNYAFNTDSFGQQSPKSVNNQNQNQKMQKQRFDMEQNQNEREFLFNSSIPGIEDQQKLESNNNNKNDSFDSKDNIEQNQQFQQKQSNVDDDDYEEQYSQQQHLNQNNFMNTSKQNNNVYSNKQNSKIKQQEKQKNIQQQQQQQNNYFVEEEGQTQEDLQQKNYLNYNQQGVFGKEDQQKQLLEHNKVQKQPFLFAAHKLDTIYKDIADSVGPGYYDVKHKDWVKKSYNKKFQAQQQENYNN